MHLNAACSQAVGDSAADNMPPALDYQTPFGFCNAISRVRETAKRTRSPGESRDPPCTRFVVGQVGPGFRRDCS